MGEFYAKAFGLAPVPDANDGVRNLQAAAAIKAPFAKARGATGVFPQ